MIRVVVYSSTDEDCPERLRFVATLINRNGQLPMIFSGASAAFVRDAAQTWLDGERAKRDAKAARPPRKQPARKPKREVQ